MKDRRFMIFLISAELFLAVLGAAVGVIRDYSIWYYIIPLGFLGIAVRDIYLYRLHRKFEKMLTDKARELIHHGERKRR